MLKPFFEFFTLWVVLPAARSVGTIEKRMSYERVLLKKNDRSPALSFLPRIPLVADPTPRLPAFRPSPLTESLKQGSVAAVAFHFPGGEIEQASEGRSSLG